MCVCLDLLWLSHPATVDAAHWTPAPLRLHRTGQIQIFWLLTTAKRVVSSKPDCRLQSISSHKAMSDVTDAMSVSLCIWVPLVLVIQRDRASNEKKHCGVGGRSVCVSLSLIIIAYSISLTQHSAERAQSTA